MDFNSINTLLIIRLSSLGDVLLTTPVIRSIKKKNPNIEIDFLVREEFNDAVKYNPNLNNIHTFLRNRDNSNLESALKKNNYDLVIDLQNNFRSKKLTRIIGVDVIKFSKPSIKKFMLVHTKVNLLRDAVQISVKYADSISDNLLDEEGLALYLPPEMVTNAGTSNKVVGFCPGAQHFTKMWPKEYFFELGNKLSDENYRVLLFGGKTDRELCEELSQQIKGAHDLSTDNNLFEIADNMMRCNVIVCNDSGLMHTASAMQIPLIAIFGSSVREFGFTPYKVKNAILENKNLSCRPCSHVGKDHCPKKHFDCMNKITPQLVYENILRLSRTL